MAKDKDTICPQPMAGCIKMPFGMEVGLSPGDFVSDGDPIPSLKRGRCPPPPKKMARLLLPNSSWMKMPLGSEVGLGPDDIVVDGDPAPLPKKGAKPPPQLLAHILKPNGWMDQDGTWRGGGP